MLPAKSLSASELEAALEGLSTINDVEVTKFSFMDNDALFAVTFIEPYGDVELLTVDDSMLSGTSVALTVVEDRKGNFIGTGTFRVYNNTAESDALRYDASAKDVAQAVRSLGSWLDGVQVSRTGPTLVGGYTWSVTFPEHMGDASLLQVNAAGLVGVGSTANVAELHKGKVVAVQTLRTTATSPLSGSFAIGFNGQETELLPYNASAAEVESALEELSSVHDVSVARRSTDQDSGRFVTSRLSASYPWIRSYLDVPLNQYEWSVTFDGHNGPQPLMTMCCGAADVFTGAQTLFAESTQDAGFEVESVITGTALPLDGNFRVVIDGVQSDSIPTHATPTISVGASGSRRA
jgi:hypothetical protein